MSKEFQDWFEASFGYRPTAEKCQMLKEYVAAELVQEWQRETHLPQRQRPKLTARNKKSWLREIGRVLQDTIPTRIPW